MTIKTSILSKTYKSTIRALDWDYSGKYLSAASFDNSISIWKITNENSPFYFFRFISVLESSNSEIRSVNWPVSGNFVACCSKKENIWVWKKMKMILIQKTLFANQHLKHIKGCENGKIFSKRRYTFFMQF